MGKIVKLVSCDNSFQANLIKGRLESEGIPSMLANERMGGLYGGNTAGWGSVDLLVNEEDLERAQALLE